MKRPHSLDTPLDGQLSNGDRVALEPHPFAVQESFAPPRQQRHRPARVRKPEARKDSRITLRGLVSQVFSVIVLLLIGATLAVALSDRERLPQESALSFLKEMIERVHPQPGALHEVAQVD